MFNRLDWRVSGATSFVAGWLAAQLIRGIVAFGRWHRLPRAVIAPVERVLIAAWGQDLFDARFYLARNPDVLEKGHPALRHYLRCGWRENRAPNAQFQDDHYRALSGLPVHVPVSLLAHYLAIGRRHGLAPVPFAHPEVLGRAAPALEVARLDGYRGLVNGAIQSPDEGRPELSRVLKDLEKIKAHGRAAAAVDVIIPVYRGRSETLNTVLHALTARNRIVPEIVVIDDATPDTDLAADLDRLARRGVITLLRNLDNRGFPASINRGSALHPDRDVIWLNADTEVYDGWIDRLRAAAYSRPDVATVTPLTNNGTICSYPRNDSDNFGVLEVPWSTVDRLASSVNAGERVESPTAVGFATYVPRRALDAVGGLDAATFGKGYGEENDFSQRAIRAGWCNLLAADVVVRHFGATSFEGRRADRVASAMRAMDRIHPRYRRDVDAFVREDPLGPARWRLDLARLTYDRTGRAALLITHSRGGGTAQHVQEEAARLIADGWTVYALTGGESGQGTARLARVGAGPMPALEDLDFDGDALWDIVRSLDPARVDIHHLIDFPRSAPETVVQRLSQIGLTYQVMVHDYFSVCPRINMVDHRGLYCGEPDTDGCARCLLRRGSVAGRVDVREWRRRYEILLRGANRLRVPDDDVGQRLMRYFPDLSFVTVPHDQTEEEGLRRPMRPGPGLRIAVVGAIGPVKGFDSVLALARHVLAKRLPVQITVIGYTHNDVAARAAGVDVTGAYTNDKVQDLIARTDPDVIWIPSLWPETYCYTLSIALSSRRPVAVFDLGAQAARLRRTGRGHILPLDDALSPGRMLKHLEAAAIPVADSSREVA